MLCQKHSGIRNTKNYGNVLLAKEVWTVNSSNKTAAAAAAVVPALPPCVQAGLLLSCNIQSLLQSKQHKYSSFLQLQVTKPQKCCSQASFYSNASMLNCRIQVSRSRFTDLE